MQFPESPQRSNRENPENPDVTSHSWATPELEALEEAMGNKATLTGIAGSAGLSLDHKDWGVCTHKEGMAWDWGLLFARCLALNFMRLETGLLPIRSSFMQMR